MNSFNDYIHYKDIIFNFNLVDIKINNIEIEPYYYNNNMGLFLKISVNIEVVITDFLSELIEIDLYIVGATYFKNTTKLLIKYEQYLKSNISDEINKLLKKIILNKEFFLFKNDYDKLLINFLP